MNINSKSISSGITPRAARMYTQGLPVGSGDRQQQGLSRRRQTVTMDWSGIQVLTAAHLSFVTEAKQEYIVQTTSVVRQMSGGIFPVLPVSRYHTPENTASSKMMHLTRPLNSQRRAQRAGLAMIWTFSVQDHAKNCQTHSSAASVQRAAAFTGQKLGRASEH